MLLGICIIIILDFRFIIVQFELLKIAIADGNYQSYFNQYAGKYKSIPYSKGQAIPLFIFIQILIIVGFIYSIKYFVYSFQKNE